MSVGGVLCILVGTILAVLGIMVIVIFVWAYNDEKKHYNNGVCPQCGEKLKYFETDPEDGSRGYECPNKKCDYTCWVSWEKIDKVNDNDTYQISDGVSETDKVRKGTGESSN